MKTSNYFPIISASIMTANILRLEEEIKAADAAGVDWIHVDIMDGQFVPNFGFCQTIVESIRAITKKLLDVHLMVANPGIYIESFAAAGADIISVHVETANHLRPIFREIKSFGKMTGVVLNPMTPIKEIHPVLEDCDMVTLMSVRPGYTGQPFLPSTLNKIQHLRKVCQNRGLNPWIEVDGGIRLHNAKMVFDAGANALVVGSTLFKSKNYSLAVDALKTGRTDVDPL